MTIKGILTLCLFISLAIGVAVIAGDVGNAIELSSRQDAHDRTQKRHQQQEEWELEQEGREEVNEEWIALEEILINTFYIVGPILIVGIALISLYTYHRWTLAQIKRTDFEATQVKMDARTRTYPLLTFAGANGSLRIHDPNTKATMNLMLDAGSEPLAISHSTAVQLQSMAPNDKSMIDVTQLKQLVLDGGKE